jgi:hypothetical protein
MSALTSSTVMAGLVPATHAFMARRFQGVGGRNKCGHDVQCCLIQGRAH